MKDRDLEEIRLKLHAFAKARDWEKFHNPKNLAMALMVEAAELQEIFQWLTLEEAQQLSEEKLEAASEEVADVLLFLIRLADVLKIDLVEAAKKKITINEEKYPAEKVKGSAKKYTEY